MKDFVLEKIMKMRKSGMKEIEVAEFFGYSTNIDLRHMISERNKTNRTVLASMAKEMKEAGSSVSEIAEKLGYNESSIRLLLNDQTEYKEE